MTADAPKRRRGRPPIPPAALSSNPFDAPADQPKGAGRKKTTVRKALVEALLNAPAPRGGVRPATALAEAMFPTPALPLRGTGATPPPEGVRCYRNAGTLPREDALFPWFDQRRYLDTGTAAQRNADGRAGEAVERWLGGQPDLHWLTAIEERQRLGEVNHYAAVHAYLAEALEAFAAAPASEAARSSAEKALALLPPEPETPPGGSADTPLADGDDPGGDNRQPPEDEDKDKGRLTPKRLEKAAGDPAALAALAAEALSLAADCRRVVAEEGEWRLENSIARGRSAVAREVARLVAAFFAAAGMDKHVRPAREGRERGTKDERRPANAYCWTVYTALQSLGLPSSLWRHAAEEVCWERSPAAARSAGAPGN